MVFLKILILLLARNVVFSIFLAILNLNLSFIFFQKAIFQIPSTQTHFISINFYKVGIKLYQPVSISYLSTCDEILARVWSSIDSSLSCLSLTFIPVGSLLGLERPILGISISPYYFFFSSHLSMLFLNFLHHFFFLFGEAHFCGTKTPTSQRPVICSKNVLIFPPNVSTAIGGRGLNFYLIT